MKRGEGLIQVNAQSDSLLDIGIVSLDGVFPKNEIIGKIIDGSTKNPIFGAAVYCEESAQDVLTDSLGGFVIQLNTLKSVTLNAWHPLYDSIRFVVSKEYIRTTKEIEIYFQSQRMTSEGKTVKLHSDSAVLLLVDVMPWSSWTVQPYEFSNSIYTYEVLQGEVFGPTSDWFYNDCVPFRLIRELPDKTAWIQFSREFKLITAGMNSKTNFLFLSDSTVLLNTRSLDGGTTVSLNLQPDYSPRGLIKKTEYGGRRNRDIPSEKKQVDSCDILKAQVERTHMENILSLLQGDFVSFAKSFSKSYKNPENKQNLPLEEFLKITSEGELPSKFAEKRLLEIFNILYAEEYV
ncbi:MAG: hypothetical protein ACRD5H_10370, partial [Nitrososphaerales archaeon]